MDLARSQLMVMKKQPAMTICLFILLRTAASAVVPATEVAGAWDLKVVTGGGTATPSIVLRQQGEKLTGTYKGRMGEVPLEGMIKDGEIRFSVTLKFQDREIAVRYSGKVEGETMSGNVQFQNSATGKWTAHRKTESK